MTGERIESSGSKETLQESKTGFGVILHSNTGRILIGRRSGFDGYGKFALPGGGLEISDNGDYRHAAAREVMEEAGIDISREVGGLKVVSVDTSFLGSNGWTNYGFLVELDYEPVALPLQPDEISSWGWRGHLEIPIDEVYPPSRISLECYLKGEILYPFSEGPTEG